MVAHLVNTFCRELSNKFEKDLASGLGEEETSKQIKLWESQSHLLQVSEKNIW